jgi:MoaA/NifB/PqqE/SkfB family radical SAM enzyme
MIDRISIEVTNRCQKACWFCYNSSAPDRATSWTGDELVTFISDCAANGVKAVSLGGGEPLEFPELFRVLRSLDSRIFRSITSNGLPLQDAAVFSELIAARPDKIHLSIHFPDRAEEVTRVIEQLRQLDAAGIRSGINMVISRANASAAESAVRLIHAAGIDNTRIIFLPMRIREIPDATVIAQVAGTTRFQSMSCLMGCAKSPRFVSIAADKTVAWCSYTTARNPLPDLTWAGLTRTMAQTGLTFCGGDE